MSSNNIYNPPNCLKFSGYKPCAPYKICEECSEPVPVEEYILFISLEAQGAVLMSTSLLRAIKNRYPGCYLIWLTRQEATPLLEHNHLIDRVLPWNDENRMMLGQIEFDISISLDKSHYTGAFANTIKAGEKYGFGLSSKGCIIPFNNGALYNYRLGLSDSMKFHENKRTVVDILHETIELPNGGNKYVLNLSPEEISYKNMWAEKAGLSKDDVVIGINTGCSNLFPNKKMTIDQHVTLIKMLYDHNPEAKIILLGGREDTKRNIEIQKLFGNQIINTPTTEGLRRGIMYVDIADIVISGDSLGMHLAIGLDKYVVVWFGLSCSEEIELFDRGEKILSGVSCEPCWKKSCDDLKCLRELSLSKICDAVIRGIEVIKAEKAGQKVHSAIDES
jgi:heptosyltransferase-2